MPRTWIGNDVFNEAVDRMVRVYESGDRVVVSFSAGKDSGVCLELCVIAATLTDRLPVEVVMRDEEIMYPGTFEYAERCAERPEIDFHWLIANQPVLNIFNRKLPYFWTFDPMLDQDEWVRQPPSYAQIIPEKNINSITSVERFPPDEGKALVTVIGLRGQESQVRALGVFSSGGYMTKLLPTGERKCRPIYDWTDGDVWRAIKENGWDYNSAYDVMAKVGISRAKVRISPPTMAVGGIKGMQKVAAVWPRWFDRVCARCPGVRSALHYGARAVEPHRRWGESWERCFYRTCVENAPPWIAERSIKVVDQVLKKHRHHSKEGLPEINQCNVCAGTNIASWKKLAMAMYCGDPFSMKTGLPLIQPEFFRPGAGEWGGKPSW